MWHSLSQIKTAQYVQTQVILILEKGPNRRQIDKKRLEYEKEVLDRLKYEEKIFLASSNVEKTHNT